MLVRRKVRKMTPYVLLGLGAALLALVGLVLARYRREIRMAHQQADALGSDRIDTDCGVIEVLERGEGYPVLVIHGIWGGVDQGIRPKRGVFDSGFVPKMVRVCSIGGLRTNSLSCHPHDRLVLSDSPTSFLRQDLEFDHW
jgi:hypothetical protein